MSAELVARAQRGDHEAFEDLVRAPYDRLYAVARRILRDSAAAEDAVQEALVHAWRDLRGLREPDRFDAWLHRLLVNACRDHARRAKRRPIEVQVLSIDRADEGDAATRLAEWDAIERAFLRLPVEQRAALVLTHYMGYQAAEVAEILGIPAGTVYSRIHYGAAAMRVALDDPVPVAASPTEQAR